jgi:hypothetical protein
MKKLILAAFALTAAVGVFAQGTVVLDMYHNGSTTHVWTPSTNNAGLSLVGMGTDDSPAGSVNFAAAGMSYIGANGLAGKYGASTTFAQLLWANGAGAAESSLVPGGQTTTFRTGTTAGRINLITDSITGLPLDSGAATFEMVAWDNSSGAYPTWTQASVAWLAGTISAGKSGAFTLQAIGGTANVPPYTTIPSFNLTQAPEPTTLALVGLGAAAMLIIRRRK